MEMEARARVVTVHAVVNVVNGVPPA